VTVSESKSQHQGGRGEREADPRGKAAQPTTTQQPDGKSDLAAGRTRHGLRERNDLCIGGLTQPAPAFNELRAKVAEVCDRPAKGGAAEAQESEQHLH
jgi:hypothetical protein